MATAVAAPSDASSNAADRPSASWWAMLKATVNDWLEDKAMKLAASLALYAMLSIAPLLVILTKIIGVMFRDEAAQGKVAGFLQQVMGGAAGNNTKAIEEMIQAAGTHGSGIMATTLAIAMAAFGATGVFGELQDSMNTIWEVKPKPNQGIWGFIRTRFLSLGMVLGIAFLLMVSTIGTTLITTLGGWITGGNTVIAAIISTVVSLAVMTVLFAMIFKLLPDAKVRWKDVWVGAVLTAVLFEAGKHALALYLRGSATSVFGAAGFLASMLLWIYYSAQILFFGAEFTQVWSRAHGREIRPDKHAVKVTEEDRAQEGRASPERIERKTAEQEGRAVPARAETSTGRQPAYAGGGGGRGVAGIRATMASAESHAIDRQHARRHPPRGGSNGNGAGGDAKPYAFAGAGSVLGALVGGIAVQYLLHNPNRPTRRQLAAVKLNERLDRVERRVGHISRLKALVENVNLKERIDEVEEEVRRAGRHVRARETNRPLWAVRLGDAIGGRWSNLKH